MQHACRSYVSFVEIFCAKSVGAFEEAGYLDSKAWRYATLSFFGGMLVGAGGG